MARRAAADPYLYPGTDVLRNRFGIRDAGLLRLAEYAATTRRATDVTVLPLAARGFLAAHRHLFQDVYDWAGKPRTVTLAKGGSMFALPHAVGPSLEKRFADLAAKKYLRGLAAEAFAAGAAHHVSELNAIHSFREGNGRAMRLHLQQLAAQAGYHLDQERLPAKAWIDASIAAFGGDEAPLADVILGAIAPVPG